MYNNYFNRLSALIGEDKVQKLAKKKVLIIGCGGVGGYVIESLARSNIGTIIIVDFDSIDETNINRQIIALKSTIGKKKVDLFEERIKDINPNCKVIKYDDIFNEETIDEILTNDIDYLIDCCDMLSSKKLIIKECTKRNIKFISSMGTARKMDPSLLEICDISKTINDPIAKILRKFVKEEKIKKKVVVLSSKELPIDTNNVLGSNAFVPSCAGLLIGSYVVKELMKS